jgi:hypothetical protein
VQLRRAQEIIDDWNKLPSFPVSAHRSTSSLDVMRIPIDLAVLYTAAFLLLALRMNSALTVQRIAKILAADYRVLWDYLGGRLKPEWIWLFGVSTFTVIGGLIIYRNLASWLFTGSYGKLKNPKIAQLSGSLKLQVRIYCVIYALLLVFALLRINS